MKKRVSSIGALMLIAGFIVTTNGCSLFGDKFVGIGKKLFNYRCADCHGESGKGDGYNAKNLDFEPRDLTDSEERILGDLTNEEIFNTLSRDIKDEDASVVPFMPTFKNTLAEAEIWAIIAYIRTLHPNDAPKIELTSKMKKKRPRFPRIRKVNIDPAIMNSKEHIENGQSLFEETYGCLACHSIGGEGGRIGPVLDRAGFQSNADWLYRWVKNPQAIEPRTKMPNLGLTDEDAMDVVAYLKTLQAPMGPDLPAK